ncbi:FAD-dependent monooxygenase [Cryobacterium sp.]|jgi:2-polyprenyl-6-methoxyphenol hydroxylase-like FAD-dependent oxidoreductase|uniref:FAD-dependent monooxygenase n=1 Tax=Cryobacterium sp. TaxID=1926290 RepID=UPI00262B236B|nr:FAD-dependent monooxygenase [Cryobacterium sp.]MCU1447431.1 monooxygenase [Cryobacterium sp.]
MTEFDVDVLVVGAGTTGLTVALQAHALGARVRIVERRSVPFRASRATVMHPRTLELLRPLGVTDALLARGDASPSARLHLKTQVVPVSIEQLDLPGTEFPHLLLIRQADAEAVLAAALAERGVIVERGTELVRLARLRHGGARALLRSGDGQADENLLCRYLVGCDGAASLVRRSVGGWLGGDFAEDAVIADLELGPPLPPAPPVTLEPEVVHVVVGRRGLVILFNRGERATWRMLATHRAGAVREPFGQPAPPVPAEELQRLLDESGLPTHVDAVAWSARVRLQHRIASRFSRGPLFIAGDAAHVHSPAGAQGMNAGIHDAVNLGWKLAFAAGAARRATGRAEEPPAPTGPAVPAGPAGASGPAAQARSPLLDSYAQERRPADLAVLRLTRLMHWAEAGSHPFAQLARAVLVPAAAPLLPWLTRQRRLTTAGVRTLAQFWLRYPTSVLSVDVRASLVPVRGALARRGLRPGSRVADTLVRCDGRRVRAHELMATPGVHVFLQAGAREMPERLRGPFVHVHRLDDRPGTGMLVVRPDGYAAVRAPVLDERALEAWLRLVGLADG